ncbi:hypothetical protein G9A89_002789 [Geosiphon pyriformis]|nr:hypothetical protein G9A89_002789 [Geosiphon pyriformis]
MDAIKNWTILLDICAASSVVVYLLHETVSLDCLYMSLSKGFMMKDWVTDAKDLLENNSKSESLVIDLVCHFAECYRSSIWLSRAKLRAHYEKYSLLPCDKFIVSIVTGLFSVWFCGMIHNFGIKLDIHTCFGLYPQLHSVQFGFLHDFLITGVLSV